MKIVPFLFLNENRWPSTRTCCTAMQTIQQVFRVNVITENMRYNTWNFIRMMNRT